MKNSNSKYLPLLYVKQTKFNFSLNFNRVLQTKGQNNFSTSQVYLEPWQTFKIEFFEIKTKQNKKKQTNNCWKLLTIFWKCSILDVWQGFGYNFSQLETCKKKLYHDLGMSNLKEEDNLKNWLVLTKFWLWWSWWWNDTRKSNLPQIKVKS